MPAPPKPNIDPSAFHARLQRDESPIPNSGQLQMSYSNVVDKILPSVVTIFSSGGKSESETPDIEDIPPQLRPFFYRFFGGEPGEGDEEGNPAPNPRRRGGGGAPPRQMPQTPQQKGVGSGFIISEDGYIITNNHVIDGADKIKVSVEVAGSSKTYIAKVIGTDPLSDVALIKIDATGLPFATLGDSSKLRVGDIVLAAGAPMELNRSITQGIVSALGRKGMGIVRQGRNEGYEDFIQTDASINPGNSGGPLVDSMGRVVGINTAILSRSGMNAGIGFAIPINMALSVAEDLLDDGKVQRGFLGIQIEDLDEDSAEALGLKQEGGALVKMVGADSPADKAGMEVGDVVIAVAGQKVDSSAKLRLIVSSNKPGSSVVMDVLRDGKPLALTATLEPLPGDAVAAAEPNRNNGRKGGAGGASISEVLPGLTIQNLTPAIRQRYDVPEDVQGVAVTKLDPESRAAAMGVKEGDVITHINRKPVRAVGEASDVAKTNSKTVLLKVYRGGDSMLFMVSNS